MFRFNGSVSFRLRCTVMLYIFGLYVLNKLYFQKETQDYGVLIPARR